MSDWGSTTLTLGGAAAAYPNNSDAIKTNPANLVFLKGTRIIGGNYSWLPADQSQYSFSVIDGSSQLISGVQFASIDIGPIKKTTYSLATSYRFGQFAVGAYQSTVHISGATAENGWHFTGGGGVVVPLQHGFSIGAYTKSIIDFEKNTLFPPSVHLGMLYTYPDYFHFSFEANRRFGTPGQDWNYSFGGAALIKKYYSIRAGYNWDNSTSFSFWSAGVSILGPRAEISGFFLRAVEGASGNGAGGELIFKF
jgi:hypothetical protein